MHLILQYLVSVYNVNMAKNCRQCYTSAAIYCFSLAKLAISDKLVIFHLQQFIYAFKSKQMVVHVLVHSVYRDTFITFQV